jgi:hypothetical protein
VQSDKSTGTLKRVKKPYFILPSVVIVSALLFSGCSQKAATTADLKKDVEKATASGGALSSAPPEVKTYVEQAAAAIKNDDQAGAVMSLRAVRASGQLTPEQTLSVDDMMAKARGVLVERAMRGDQQAAIQLQLLNQNSR